MTILLLLSLSARAGALHLQDGLVGPFALHGDRLAVVEERDAGTCTGGAGQPFSRLHITHADDPSSLVRTITLPHHGCTDWISWLPASPTIIVSSHADAKGRSRLRVYDTDSGELVADLGERVWGAVTVDASHLASTRKITDDSGTAWVTRRLRSSDWSFDGTARLALDNLSQPPVVVRDGAGLMALAEGRLWIYDLAEGVLSRSLPAPEHAPELLQLTAAASPEGGSRLYVANDYQSGFTKPFPKVDGSPLPKHVLSVPDFSPWCAVSGDGVEGMRDFQQGWRGDRRPLQPDSPPPARYQHAVAWDTLIAFLMPPVDTFRNPFGAGQTAFVIRTHDADCTAIKITELGREAFGFDADAERLVLTIDKDPKGPWYRGLQTYPLPKLPAAR